MKAGELKEWRRQVPIELRVNNQKVCTYTIDFVEVDKNGNEMWTEIKGFETPEWRIKWNLYEAFSQTLKSKWSSDLRQWRDTLYPFRLLLSD